MAAALGAAPPGAVARQQRRPEAPKKANCVVASRWGPWRCWRQPTSDALRLSDDALSRDSHDEARAQSVLSEAMAACRSARNGRFGLWGSAIQTHDQIQNWRAPQWLPTMRQRASAGGCWPRAATEGPLATSKWRPGRPARRSRSGVAGGGRGREKGRRCTARTWLTCSCGGAAGRVLVGAPVRLRRDAERRRRVLSASAFQGCRAGVWRSFERASPQTPCVCVCLPWMGTGVYEQSLRRAERNPGPDRVGDGKTLHPSVKTPPRHNSSCMDHPQRHWTPTTTVCGQRAGG